MKDVENVRDAQRKIKEDMPNITHHTHNIAMIILPSDENRKDAHRWKKQVEDSGWESSRKEFQNADAPRNMKKGKKKKKEERYRMSIAMVEQETTEHSKGRGTP